MGNQARSFIGITRRTRQFVVNPEDLRSEFFQNISHPICDVKQRSGHNPLSDNRRSLIKDYVEQAVRLHFHILSTKGMPGSDEGTLRNYCVVMECPTLADCLRYTSRIDKRRELEIKCLYRPTSQMQHAVLIEIGNLVQMPKWTRGALPCRERLERFDKSCSLVAYPCQHAEAVRIEFGKLGENRELESRSFGGQVLAQKNKQLKYCVVESRTEVVNNFSDLYSPHWIAGLVDEHPDRKVSDTPNTLTSVLEFCRVEIDRRFIRVAIIKKSSHFTLERVELLAGSLKFKGDS